MYTNRINKEERKVSFKYILSYTAKFQIVFIILILL